MSQPEEPSPRTPTRIEYAASLARLCGCELTLRVHGPGATSVTALSWALTSSGSASRLPGAGALDTNVAFIPVDSTEELIDALDVAAEQVISHIRVRATELATPVQILGARPVTTPPHVRVDAWPPATAADPMGAGSLWTWRSEVAELVHIDRPGVRGTLWDVLMRSGLDAGRVFKADPAACSPWITLGAIPTQKEHVRSQLLLRPNPRSQAPWQPEPAVGEYWIDSKDFEMVRIKGAAPMGGNTYEVEVVAKSARLATAESAGALSRRTIGPHWFDARYAAPRLDERWRCRQTGDEFKLVAVRSHQHASPIQDTRWMVLGDDGRTYERGVSWHSCHLVSVTATVVVGLEQVPRPSMSEMVRATDRLSMESLRAERRPSASASIAVDGTVRALDSLGQSLVRDLRPLLAELVSAKTVWCPNCGTRGVAGATCKECDTPLDERMRAAP